MISHMLVEIKSAGHCINHSFLASCSVMIRKFIGIIMYNYYLVMHMCATQCITVLLYIELPIALKFMQVYIYQIYDIIILYYIFVVTELTLIVSVVLAAILLLLSVACTALYCSILCWYCKSKTQPKDPIMQTLICMRHRDHKEDTEHLAVSRFTFVIPTNAQSSTDSHANNNVNNPMSSQVMGRNGVYLHQYKDGSLLPPYEDVFPPYEASTDLPT